MKHGHSKVQTVRDSERDHRISEADESMVAFEELSADGESLTVTSVSLHGTSSGAQLL